MTRWHEPNEYGFAGDITLPEVRRDRPSEREEVEAEAIPVYDLPRDLAEGVEEATDTDGGTGRQGGTGEGEDRH